MNIDQIIETLRAMMENSRDCAAELKKDHHFALSNRLSGEAEGLQSAIWMLTDPAYAEKMRATFSPETEPQTLADYIRDEVKEGIRP